MGILKEKMINKAKTLHDDIYPCSSKQDLDECFTVDEDTLIFWFNTKDNSTHILSEAI
jgi:hypothetical protein